MNIEIRAYEKGDERLIEPIENTIPFRQDLWDSIVIPHLTRTCYYDGKPLFIGGFSLVENRTTLWLVMDKKARKEKKVFMRMVKMGMSLIESYRIPELFAYVKDDFVEGCRLLRHFGFKRVSKNKSYYLYRR